MKNGNSVVPGLQAPYESEYDRCKAASGQGKTTFHPEQGKLEEVTMFFRTETLGGAEDDPLWKRRFTPGIVTTVDGDGKRLFRFEDGLDRSGRGKRNFLVLMRDQNIAMWENDLFGSRFGIRRSVIWRENSFPPVVLLRSSFSSDSLHVASR